MRTCLTGRWLTLTVVLLLVGAGTAQAQSIPPPPPPPPPAPNSTLGNVSGLTETQQLTATAVQSVCGRLTTLNAQSPLAGDVLDLWQRCREMVQTGNALLGSGSTTFSLGLDAAGLAEALSGVAPDEVSVQGTLAGETGSPQFRLLAPRLASLRRGGPALSLDLDLGGKKFAMQGNPAVLLDAGASADAGSGALGVFLNGSFTFGDKDSTSREVGFEFDSYGLLGGVDYRFTPNLIAGIALGYDYTDADFDSFLGDVETNTYSATLYGTYYVGPWYLDGHAGFGWNEYDTTRRILYAGIDRTATGETDAQQYTVGLGTGYAITRGAFTVTPIARAEYLRLEIDGYSERGADGLNLTIRSQDLDSFQTALGASVSYVFSVPFGVLVPQVRAEWRHEFLNNDRDITAKYTADPFNTFFSIPTDRPDRDFVALAAGLSVGMARGVSAFVNYETILGLRDISHHDFRGGVRIEF